MVSANPHLDLFSTSQTNFTVLGEIEQICAPVFCVNNAPYFAYHKREKTYGVIQGCCNSWNCPRCGELRAKQEYGRIVQGAKTLSENHELWFITITCRGRKMTKGEADVNYGKWTNTLLTNWRTSSSRAGQEWYYAQVTERQARGHPHSHILTSFSPNDITLGTKRKWTEDFQGNKVWEDQPCLRSDYVRRSCVSAGLGDQYDISRVSSVEGASRYVAKYLFKDTVFSTIWPKGWRRVRYSQQWPKLPKKQSEAFVLMTREDWRKLARVALIVTSDSDQTKEMVYNNLRGADVFLK